jgi:hypothetical protein
VELAKANLTHLGSLERLEVLWNPESYSLSRQSRIAAASAWGAPRATPQAIAGGLEEFTTDLLLDSTRLAAGERDLRPLVDKL